MTPGATAGFPHGVTGDGADAGRAIDEESFRRTLRHFPTGVVAITAMDGATPVGMIVGTFFSVSLNPILIGFCVNQESTTWLRIEAAGQFCVNILADDQATVASSLARPAVREKFTGTDWELSDHNSPVVTGAIARIECVPAAIHPAGDHAVVIGAVRDLTVLRERLPLVRFRRAFHSLNPNGLAQ
jgi:flavin reductase (DIM6/NTAB) family NADH-FMN oxidoreductase RutF